MRHFSVLPTATSDTIVPLAASEVADRVPAPLERGDDSLGDVRGVLEEQQPHDTLPTLLEILPRIAINPPIVKQCAVELDMAAPN